MQKPTKHASRRTRIKFCGIRRAADAEQAVVLGVDALGFVLVPQSRRHIPAETAARIRKRLPPFVAVVALFQNADAAQVQLGVDVLKPDVLQFHGDEPAGFCESFGLPYVKAFAMGGSSGAARLAGYRSAAAWLLDSHAPGTMGGSGKVFDWSCLPSMKKPLILAGGLNAGNVARAVRELRPFAVDVSSGIELTPGIKDSAKMRAFVAAVRRADLS